MVNEIILEKKDILEKIKMLHPYVFVDKVRLVPGEKAWGEKFFSHDEWFFPLHFPNNPCVPGVFQLECLMHTAVLSLYCFENKNDIFFYARDYSAKHFRFVKPDEMLYTYTEINSYKRGVAKITAEAWVMEGYKKVVTCKSEFQLMSPEIMACYLPTQKG